MSEFATSLHDRNKFTITYELVPGQGAGGRQVERLLAFTRQAKEDGRIKALSITDNAGGHPALAPFAIGSEVQKIGLDPLIHFSLKDKNRNQAESLLLLYQRQGFRSLLVLGGDYPKSGYHGQPKPVFDLDTMQALRLMQSMESGRRHHNCEALAVPADKGFLRGCVVSPFKHSEEEQVWQYGKLLRKLQAGAHFIITQLGFDCRKFAELKQFLHAANIDIPVLANVFIPSLGVARAMVNGKVPGVLFPTRLLKLIEQETASQTTTVRLERAAKMCCVLRGLGYSGVHLGGNGLTFDDVRCILDQAAALQGSWQELLPEVDFPIADTWYCYDNPIAARPPQRCRPLSPGRKRGALLLHQAAHRLLFSRATPSGRLFGHLCLFMAKSRIGTVVMKSTERAIKGVLFSCLMCGDCTLAETTYLCPQSGCPKSLINGPCGGSRNKACEVFPEKLCFWVRVYGRLDTDSTIDILGAVPSLPPKDWALDQSSSWINYFTGRDHTRHETKTHSP